MELRRGSAIEAVDAMEMELDFAFRGGRGFEPLFGQCLSALQSRLLRFALLSPINMYFEKKGTKSILYI